MEYKVTINKKTYALPARTLDVDEQIEAVGNLDEQYRAKELTRREVVEKLHEFVSTFAPDSLPGVEEVDTNELLKAAMDIIGVYNAPMFKTKADAQMAQVKDVLNRPEMQKMAAVAAQIHQ